MFIHNFTQTSYTLLSTDLNDNVYTKVTDGLEMFVHY